MTESKGMTLYELAEGYRHLTELATTDELPADVIRDTLDGLQGDLKVKATNVAKFLAHLDASAQAIEEASKKMAQRAATIRKRSESLRHYVLFSMQANGITRIETPEVVLKIVKNPPAVHIAEGAVLPAKYMVVPVPATPYPDKAALKAALVGGAHIEGVSLDQGERLEIK